jgi:hypothetical protein
VFFCGSGPAKKHYIPPFIELVPTGSKRKRFV